MKTIQELAEHPSVRNGAMAVSSNFGVPFNLIVCLVIERSWLQVETEYLPRNEAGRAKAHQIHPMPPELSAQAFEGEVPAHVLKVIVVTRARDAQCVSLAFTA